MLTFPQIFGILVAFWVTYGSQNISGQWSWRLAFTVQIFPGKSGSQVLLQGARLGSEAHRLRCLRHTLWAGRLVHAILTALAGIG